MHSTSHIRMRAQLRLPRQRSAAEGTPRAYRPGRQIERRRAIAESAGVR